MHTILKFLQLERKEFLTFDIKGLLCDIFDTGDEDFDIFLH